MERRLDEARDAANLANRGLQKTDSCVDGIGKELVELRKMGDVRYSNFVANQKRVRDDLDAMKKLQNIQFASSLTSTIVLGACARTLLGKAKWGEPWTSNNISAPLGFACAAGSAFMCIITYFAY